MKKLIWFMAFVAVMAVSTTIDARAGINIVTSTEDLASIVREVGGDKVSVEALAKGYQDPHFVEAKPSFVLKLHSADLLVAVGRELEIGWLPPLITQSRNAKIQPGGPGYLDASTTVRILDIPTGQVTRAMGDVHPQGNPHYWLDPAQRPADREGRSKQADVPQPERRRLLRAAVCRLRSAAGRRREALAGSDGAIQRHEDRDLPSLVAELRRGLRPRRRRLRRAQARYSAVAGPPAGPDGGDEAAEHQDHPRRAVFRFADPEQDRARYRGQGPGDDAVGGRRQGSHELHRRSSTTTST